LVIPLAVGAAGCFSGLVDVEGLSETQRSDASSLDGGQDALSDTPSAESSLPDTSLPDTSLPDTSLPDTSSPDTSSDAQPDSPTPDSSDAPLDSSSPEAGDAFDDSPDTSDASGGWCETQGAGALFCDDFENAIAWDAYNVSPKSYLEITSALSLSPEHALEFHSDALTQAGTGEGFRTKSMAASSQAITFSYGLWVEQVPANQGASIPSQWVLRDGSELVLRLSILIAIPYEVSLEIEVRPPGQQASYLHYPFATSVDPGQWVEVKYVLSASPRKLSIYFDNAIAINDVPLTMLDGSPVASEIRVGGCYVEAPSDPWTFVYDNVLFR
jgi:hypothetical protein